MEGMLIRIPKVDDFANGLLEIFPEMTEEKYRSALQGRKSEDGYIDRVVEEESTGKVLAVASVLVERKFIRGGGRVAHIEALVVYQAFRNQGIGKKLLENVLNEVREQKCYKAIYICPELEIEFYEKFRFQRKAVCMEIEF